MDTTLVFQPAVGAAALDADDDVLDAAMAGFAERHQLDLPALPLGEARVAAIEIAGEQRRLFAAGAGADFEHDVALVVRVLRHEQHLEIVGDALLADVEIVELLEREVAHLGIAALDQLLGACDLGDDGLVLAVFVYERLDLGERLGLLAVLVGIALHLRGAKRRHQLFVLGLGRCNLVEHILRAN